MTSIVDKLMMTPKKDVGQEQPHTPHHYPKDYKHQLDLLYLPHDLDKRYALVVVDVGTRKCDAEPMAKRRPKDTIRALEAIYKRGILKQPSMLYFDAGTEFKGEFRTYLQDKDILYRASKTGRHRQTSLVENKNKYIAKALFRRQLEEEMLTGEVSKQWTDQLKEVIATINKKIKPFKKKVFPNKIVKTANTSKLLDTIEEVQEEKAPVIDPLVEKEKEIQEIKEEKKEVKKKKAKKLKEDLDDFKASTHRLNVLKQFLSEQADEDLERRIGSLIDAEIKMKYDRIFKDSPKERVLIAKGRGRKKKIEKNTDETYCVGDSCILLPVGTKVRRQLDVPADYLTGKRLIGTFRATDIRFSKEPQTISDVVIKPGSPPLYILDDDTSTAYTKNQLQVIGEEIEPDEKAIARFSKIKGVKTYKVQKIVGHKMKNRKKFYEVKWLGFKDTTLEPIKIIREDVPEIVAEYEQSLKD